MRTLIRAKPSAHLSYNFQVSTHGIQKCRKQYNLICKQDKCREWFSNIQDLNSHHRLWHRNTFRCAKCFKSCPTPSSFKAHLYSHCDNQFKCKQCNKTFPILSEVANHKRAHLKQRLFKCFAGSCHHAFKHPQDLHCHIGRHFNTYFICNECGHWTFEKRLLK